MMCLFKDAHSVASHKRVEIYNLISACLFDTGVFCVDATVARLRSQARVLEAGLYAIKPSQLTKDITAAFKALGAHLSLFPVRLLRERRSKQEIY